MGGTFEKCKLFLIRTVDELPFLVVSQPPTGQLPTWRNTPPSRQLPTRVNCDNS